MNYVFFGTPELAAIILEKLIKAGWAPAAVVCNPDKPVGRKKIITPPPVKKMLIEKFKDLKIEILQPENLKIENSKLKIENFDLGVVAAYGKIIPKKIIDTFPKGIIGVHPSLLPKYRGATPIQSVILNGEKETGVSLFLMDEQIDHGPILAKREFSIQNLESSSLNYETLMRKLAELAGDLLIETLSKFLKGEYTLQPQNDKEATYAGKITTDDGYVDLEKDDPIMVERKVRALNPEPGVWTYGKILRQCWEVEPPNIVVNLERFDLKRVKILEAELKNGKLKLKKIQFEGKKPQIL